jgi:hypothetical protein
VPRYDVNAQSLIGKLLRVESFISRRHPNNRNPRMPDWKMLVRSPSEYAVISEDKWPQQLAKPVDRRNALEKNRDDIEAKTEELIDLEIKLVRTPVGSYWAKNRHNCYRRYRELERRRTRDVMKKKRGAYLRNTEAYVRHWLATEWLRNSRNRGPADNCGYYFASDLKRNPAALGLTLIAFSARHHADPSDAGSARMLSMIYQTGRGGLKDAKKAAEWEARARKRKARLGK